MMVGRNTLRTTMHGAQFALQLLLTKGGVLHNWANDILLTTTDYTGTGSDLLGPGVSLDRNGHFPSSFSFLLFFTLLKSTA